MVVITKLQHNQLFDFIGTGGLQQSMCSFADPETDEQFGATYCVIRQVASDSHLMVWPDRDHFASYKVRMKVGGVEATHLFDGPWDQVLANAQEWSRRVVYELEEPDLWAELARVPEVFALATADEDNAPFTPEERQAISARFEEVKAEVRKNGELTGELTGEQLARIEQKLDDLKEATERVSKKDWKMMLLGAALSITGADAVPPHVVQMILVMVVSGIGHIFGLGGGPPPVLPPLA